MKIGSPHHVARSGSIWLQIGLLAAVPVVMIAIAGWIMVELFGADAREGEFASAKARRGSVAGAGLLPLPKEEMAPADPAFLKKLSPEDSIAFNARIPIAAGINPAAAPFALPLSDGRGWVRALDCMTAAIYYEAGQEPADGQRAVAQVILNRVRHGAYPDTVCGVVFEGHERTTGCQFTFTCDGSLVRKPVAVFWERARKVAAAALAGSVYAPVGWSTNYHANYVVPYWSSSLLKIASIGNHIFYRLPGRGGGGQSFARSHSGMEEEKLSILAMGGFTAPDAEDGAAQLAEGVTPEARTILANDLTAEAARPVATQAPRAASRWVIGMNTSSPAPPEAGSAGQGKEEAPGARVLLKSGY